MLNSITYADPLQVALRKESVDRNSGNSQYICKAGESLSARRAWIEIPRDLASATSMLCRSPQGERG